MMELEGVQLNSLTVCNIVMFELLLIIFMRC